MKEKILVSGCLLGKNTKYNGNNNYVRDIERLKEKYDLILVCPEVAGGLSIPRKPSEVVGTSVLSSEGKNVTESFNKGALTALYLVKKYHITRAVLKESSPSCGSHFIYDGTFTGKKIIGRGITAKLLMDNGVKVFSEKELNLIES